MADIYQAELDAILASESMIQDEDSHKYSHMTDEHETITIQEKNVNIGDIGKILKGESNSTMLTFAIDRFYDGVDLYGKSITIICERLGLLKKDCFTEDVTNIEYSSSTLKFSWVLSEKVTYKAGIISAAVQFTGRDETGKIYALKTSPFALMVEDTLDGTDMDITVSNDWFTSIESRLNTLENATGLGDSQIITDYTQLNNIPTINGVKVTSAKSLDDYGIAAKDHTHAYTTENQATTIAEKVADEKLVGYVYVEEAEEEEEEPVDLDAAVATSVSAYLTENPETEFLNIKKMGAKGDGTTDDSTCFINGVAGYVVNDGIYCVDSDTMARLNAKNCIGNGYLRLYGAPYNLGVKDGYFSPLDYTIAVEELDNPLKKILASGSEATFYMDRPYCTRGLRPLEDANNIRTIGAIYKIKDVEVPESVTVCVGKMALFALQKDGVWRRISENKYPVEYGLFELPWVPETTKTLDSDKVTVYEDYIEFKLTSDDFAATSDNKTEAVLHFWGSNAYVENGADIIGLVSAYDLWIKEDDVKDKFVFTIGADQVDATTSTIRQAFSGIAMKADTQKRTQWGTTFNREEVDTYCDFNYIQWLYNYDTPIPSDVKVGKMYSTNKYEQSFLARTTTGDFYYKLFDDADSYRGYQLINPVKHMFLPYHNPNSGSTGVYCKLFSMPIKNTTNRYTFRINYDAHLSTKVNRTVSVILTVMLDGTVNMESVSAYNSPMVGSITAVVTDSSIDIYAKGYDWGYVVIDIEPLVYSNIDVLNYIVYDTDLFRLGTGSFNIACDKWVSIDTTDCTVIESETTSPLEKRIAELEAQIAELTANATE